jgi:hypothetical protein
VEKPIKPFVPPQYSDVDCMTIHKPVKEKNEGETKSGIKSGQQEG